MISHPLNSVLQAQESLLGVQIPFQALSVIGHFFNVKASLSGLISLLVYVLTSIGFFTAGFLVFKRLNGGRSTLKQFHSYYAGSIIVAVGSLVQCFANTTLSVFIERALLGTGIALCLNSYLNSTKKVHPELFHKESKVPALVLLGACANIITGFLPKTAGLIYTLLAAQAMVSSAFVIYQLQKNDPEAIAEEIDAYADDFADNTNEDPESAWNSEP